jgi:hypothetical protein
MVIGKITISLFMPTYLTPSSTAETIEKDVDSGISDRSVDSIV